MNAYADDNCRGDDHCVGMNRSATITLGICSDTHGDYSPSCPGRKLNAVLHAGDIYNPGVSQYGERYLWHLIHPTGRNCRATRRWPVAGMAAWRI